MLAKSVVVGVVIASAVGVLWGFIPAWNFYLSLLLGFGVAEGMAWAANYKRGSDLQMLGIGCVIVGLVISRIAIGQLDPRVTLDHLLNQAANPGVAQIFQLRVIPDFLFAGLAILIPFVRFR